jgi:hypothetical protein
MRQKRGARDPSQDRARVDFGVAVQTSIGGRIITG